MGVPGDDARASADRAPGLPVIAWQWLRIGVAGFGGPPAHIALLRQLCVTTRHWLTPEEFADGISATNLLPGPASTQLAIYCAWRLGGPVGAIVGGLCFIVPGLVIILTMSVLLLSGRPDRLVIGAAAGAGAAVAAVAVQAAMGLLRASQRRTGPARLRWYGYLFAGAVSAATVGPWLVLVLVLCGAIEVATTLRNAPPARHLPALAIAITVSSGLASLVWVAFKVGALSYGGGFVIIPLMHDDAVGNYHWMTASQFLYAVALGQITPGPVVLTVAAVGYAAGGIGGGLLAAAVAFAPSFVFVLAGARHFDRLRANDRVRAFLAGAGPAAIGAIAGSAIPLALALSQAWQVPILIAAAVWLLAVRRGVVSALLGAAVLGFIAALAGLPVG